MRKPPVPESVTSRASGHLTAKRLSTAPPPPNATSGSASIPDPSPDPSPSSELDSSSTEESLLRKKSRSGSKKSSGLSRKEIKSVCTAIPLLQKLSSLVTTLNNVVYHLHAGNQGSH